MARKKNLQDLDGFEQGYIEAKMGHDIEELTSKNNVGCSKLLQYKINIKCKNKKQKDFLNVLKDEKNEICFGIGSAGSGKSFISLSYALQELRDPETPYNKIIIVVPTCESSSKELSIGLIKGSIEDKISPYLEADSYTMEKILTQSGNNDAKNIVKTLVKSNFIQYELVNFIKGKTIDSAILMICEAEDYNKEEMLRLLTRIGDNCKLIITGDQEQTSRRDIKRNNDECGMMYSLNKLKDLDEVGYTVFDEDDIVRNPLITKIIKKFKEN